ncbi:MAG TPA: hypothetical protein VN841_18710 [Bryobacteraceae bacterium]|nr:hypothetical protein [Bryobacteraceae bacterium]
MNTILEEPKVESGADAGVCSAAAQCHYEEAAKRIEKALNDAKTSVSARLEDGKTGAERLLKRGRYAVEDGIDEAAHQIRRHPVSSLAIAFSAGALLAFLLPRPAKR